MPLQFKEPWSSRCEDLACFRARLRHDYEHQACLKSMDCLKLDSELEEVSAIAQI